jgi:hypothetical protein
MARKYAGLVPQKAESASVFADDVPVSGGRNGGYPVEVTTADLVTGDSA